MKFGLRQFRLLVLAAAVALVSTWAGIMLWKLTSVRPEAPTASLILLPEPRAIDDFSLVDQQGQPFSLERLRGQWSLLFFGFTHCPDVCPSALYDLARVNRALGQKSPDAAPLHQVVFVSVDPDRDTPERLKEYVAYFDPAFLGVTGSDQDLRPLALQLGIAYHVEDHRPEDTQYTVDHSASILLTGPDGQLHGVFPAPHDAERMISDLVALLD